MPKGDVYQNGDGTTVGVPIRRTGPMPMGQNASDLSQTPGGTIFGTTPGGTRIIYDRDFLLKMRQSPAACTPPKNLAIIPGVTSGSPKDPKAVNGLGKVPETTENTALGDTDNKVKTSSPANTKDPDDLFTME